MAYKFNPFTGKLDLTASLTGGGTVDSEFYYSIDGGFSNSIYLITQMLEGGSSSLSNLVAAINGGVSNSAYKFLMSFDGGRA